MAYASTTTVPVEKTKADIERLLTKHGANQFMSYSDPERAMIQFGMCNRMIRFGIDIPPNDEYSRTASGNRRSASDSQKVWEQACRSRWRSLLLGIKAKLDAIEVGIMSFEEEFMPYIVLPDNRTVGEFMLPQIEQAYLSGDAPKMLPGLPAPKE